MKKTTLNSLRWMVLNFSAFMLAFTPVLDGYAAQKKAQELNEARVKEILFNMGMTKQQTLGSFWAKNKSQFPPRIQALVGDLFLKHSKEKMPELEIGASKGADGKAVPVVRMQLPGHLLNVEVHDNEKYFAKVGNTELNNIDINNFTVMFEKMYHNDYQFRRWVDAQGKSAQSGLDGTKSRSIPNMSLNLWNSLSPYQRAEYFIQIRMLYREAAKVNYLLQKAKKKDQAAENGLLEQFYKFMVGEDAIAKSNLPRSRVAPAKAAKAPAVKLRPGDPVQSTTTKSNYDNTCVVAGYISKYENNVPNYRNKSTRACTIKAALEGFDPDGGEKNIQITTIYKEANSYCQQSKGSSYVACNPIIYGYRDSNQATCVDTLKEEFQRATHADGPCEKSSPLTSSNIQENIKYGKSDKYGTGPDDLQKRVDIISNDPENIAYSKAYIESFLNRSDKFAELIKAPKISAEDFAVLSNEINTIVDQFKTEIKQATDSCARTINTMLEKGSQVPADQRLACDQLHRRWIQSDKYLEELQKKVPAAAGGDVKCDPTKLKRGEKCPEYGGGAEQCLATGKTNSGKDCKPTADTLCRDKGFIVGESGDPAQGDAAIMCVCAGPDGQPAKGNLGASLADIKAGKFTKEKCSAGTGRPAQQPPVEKPQSNVSFSCDAAKRMCAEKNKNQAVNGTWEVKEVNSPGDGAQDCRCERKEEEEGWLKNNWDNIAMAAVGGVVVLALIKSAPRKPSIAPAGDLCTSGQKICPGVCPKANQVKINGVCQCRQPNPYEQLIDAVECTYAGMATGDPTSVRCPDGVTQAISLTSCPKTTCSDGTTIVYTGQTCPTETPSTKPSPTNLSDVKK